MTTHEYEVYGYPRACPKCKLPLIKRRLGQTGSDEWDCPSCDFLMFYGDNGCDWFACKWSVGKYSVMWLHPLCPDERAAFARIASELFVMNMPASVSEDWIVLPKTDMTNLTEKKLDMVRVFS